MRNKELEHKRIQEALAALGDIEGPPDNEVLKDYLSLSEDYVEFMRTRLMTEEVEDADTVEKAVRDL